MADVEKVKRDLAFGVSDRCFRDPYCGECDYYGSNGVCNFNNKNVMRDALSVIEEQQGRIDHMLSLLGEADREKERLKEEIELLKEENEILDPLCR